MDLSVMETLDDIIRSKPLLPRLHWLPRFMDRVMSGVCLAGGIGLAYMIWRALV